MIHAARMAFADEIDDLQQDLLKMGSTVEQMLHKSIEALRTRNQDLAREAIAQDDVLDRYNLAVENKCLKLLALQQPMAHDLRAIAAAMKIVTDIERMGDYVVDIAKVAVRLSDTPLFKPLVNIPAMAELVKKMLHESLQAFVSRDLKLLQRVVDADDEIDRMDKSLSQSLIDYMKSDPTLTDQAVQLLLISRYLERLADHVTNVAERVYYMETGEARELHKHIGKSDS